MSSCVSWRVARGGVEEKNGKTFFFGCHQNEKLFTFKRFSLLLSSVWLVHFADSCSEVFFSVVCCRTNRAKLSPCSAHIQAVGMSIVEKNESLFRLCKSCKIIGIDTLSDWIMPSICCDSKQSFFCRYSNNMMKIIVNSKISISAFLTPPLLRCIRYNKERKKLQFISRV